MMPPLPPYAELVAREDELRFESFTPTDAWELGCVLVELARERSAPVAIDISVGEQQLFHAALRGASADNDDWIRRKARVVRRCGMSSMAVGQLWRERGTTFEAVSGLDPREYAVSGGGYPVNVRSVGVVGVIGVSGLPELDDHQLIEDGIRAFLSRRAG